jgi:hypothetical protein
MGGAPFWRRVVDGVASIGSYPGEPETQAGGRRVLVAALVAVTLIFLKALRRRPHRLARIVNGIFVLILAVQLLETTVYGGLLESGLVVVFGLAFTLGALVAINLKVAVWWFVVFVAAVVYAVVIPSLVDPIYEVPDPTADAAFNLVATGVLVLAALAT